MMIPTRFSGQQTAPYTQRRRVVGLLAASMALMAAPSNNPSDKTV